MRVNLVEKKSRQQNLKINFRSYAEKTTAHPWLLFPQSPRFQLAPLWGELWGNLK